MFNERNSGPSLDIRAVNTVARFGAFEVRSFWLNKLNKFTVFPLFFLIYILFGSIAAWISAAVFFASIILALVFFLIRGITRLIQRAWSGRPITAAERVRWDRQNAAYQRQVARQANPLLAARGNRNNRIEPTL